MLVTVGAEIFVRHSLTISEQTTSMNFTYISKCLQDVPEKNSSFFDENFSVDGCVKTREFERGKIPIT